MASLRDWLPQDFLENVAYVAFPRIDRYSIRDDDLRCVSELRQLKGLALDGTGFTDAGLPHLTQLKHMSRLSLRYTQVTDAGLVHLKGLTALRWMDLRNTRVTEDGIADLKAALPNCLIHGP